MIHFEGIGKRYQLGETRHNTLWESIVERVNYASRLNTGNKSTSKSSNTIWALRNISFDVNEGEVVGIIGHNGAGKSTLLKILSRITPPTEGRIRMRGRVASLLEVGTGFHPELTGRENIYLNGIILGMTRQEVKTRFEEIVDFSEIEKFLDTPVKRYSSGMYVRLAFAVAAHLEPEILIVDEVLAVGDLAFQKKCLGKMETVAKTGRTVLIVSHNMSMIRSLCDHCVLLEDGCISKKGSTADVLPHYLSTHTETSASAKIKWDDLENAPGNDGFKLYEIKLLDSNKKVRMTFLAHEEITIDLSYNLTLPLRGMRILMQLLTPDGVVAFTTTDFGLRSDEPLLSGSYFSRCIIPPKLLNDGTYIIKIHVGIPGVKVLMEGRPLLGLTIKGRAANSSSHPETWPGVVAPDLKWEIGPRPR